MVADPPSASPPSLRLTDAAADSPPPPIIKAESDTKGLHWFEIDGKQFAPSVRSVLQMVSRSLGTKPLSTRLLQDMVVRLRIAAMSRFGHRPLEIVDMTHPSRPVDEVFPAECWPWLENQCTDLFREYVQT